MVEDFVDPRRSEPPYELGERAMLEAWLEFHRTTLLLKCEGLGDAGRTARPVPTSLMSLHGLVRHMAEVERNWFTRVLLRRRETRSVWCTREEPDRDWGPLDDPEWDADLATWREECEQSRLAAAAHTLDDAGLRRRQEVTLRWIYTHMVEEYARHNGHADLIREMVDGTVGW